MATQEHVTRRERAPEEPEVTREPAPPRAADPFLAWRLGVVYAPVADAVVAVFAAAPSPRPAARILEVGGEAGVLGAMLAARGAGPVDLVRAETLEDGVACAAVAPFDCVVAVDALQHVSPSERDARLRALARGSGGVVLAGPFGSEAAEAAARAVNVVHRAATGEDAPGLGRPLEIGLPDLEATRASLEAELGFARPVPLESVSAWQLAEGIAALDGFREQAGAVGPAAAALFAGAGDEGGDGRAYRWLVAAAPRPFALADEPARGRASGAAAFAAFLALELASQRRAFERLSELVTEARERERREFKEAVEALALDLREREAAAEALAIELRRRDHVISDLRAAVADWESRTEEVEEIHVKTQVHVRNLEAMVERERDRADAAEARAGSAEARAEAAEARAEAESRRALAERGRAELAERVHAEFLDGRVGRTATAYLGLKRRLFGRKP